MVGRERIVDMSLQRVCMVGGAGELSEKGIRRESTQCRLLCGLGSVR